MRKIAPLVFLAFSVLPVVSQAQNASLNSPATRTSIQKILVENLNMSRTGANAVIVLTYQDSSNATIPNPSIQGSFPSVFGVPSTNGQAGGLCTTTLAGLAGAMKNARGGEPAGNAAAINYRVLGYLIDQSCFPFAVTLNAS